MSSQGERWQAQAPGRGQASPCNRLGSEGEILSSRYGDAAGKCLYYTEYRDVPAGEDTYYEVGEEKFYTSDGDRYESKLTESDLRSHFEEVKKSYLHFKAPR